MKKMFTLLFALLLSVTMFAQQARTPKNASLIVTPVTQSFGEKVNLLQPVESPGSRGAVIFSAGFEGTTGGTTTAAGALPTGWTSIPTTGTLGVNRWGTSGGPIVGMSGNYPLCEGTRFAYIAYASTTHNAWMITPSFALTTGTTYAVEFYVAMEGYMWYEELEVWIGTAATEAGMTTKLWEEKNDDIYPWTKIKVFYTPTTTGDFYLGFHNTSYDEFYTCVDDIKVSVANDNDLAIAANFPYTQIPTFLSLPATLSANVKNEGMLTQTGVELTVDYNGTTFGPSSPVTIASEAITTLSVPFGAAPATGANTLEYTVTQNETDEDITNNSATFAFQGTTDIYACDLETTLATGGIGSNSGAITFGNIFEISDPCVLTQIVIGFGTSSTALDYTISLYKMTGELECSNVDMLNKFAATRAPGWNTITLPPTQLEEGAYFLCVNQLTSTNLSVCYSTTNPNQILYVLNPDYTLYTGNVGFAPVIRMVLSEDAEIVTITTDVSPAGAGTVTGGGTYLAGDEVTLTAKAKFGFEFAEWSDGTTANPYIFEATEDVSLTAIFNDLGFVCTPDESIIGTATTAAYTLPINTFYNYSYTQQIFTAEELGLNAGDIITEISFEYVYATAQGPGGKTNQTFYLGNTCKNGFTGSEWIPLGEMEQVYKGTVIYNNSQTWSTIVLDDPLVYTGVNVVLAVFNNHGGYNTSSNNTFRYSIPAGTRKTQQYYTDDPLNIATLTATSSATTNRSNTRFGTCKPDTDITVDMAVIGFTGELAPTTTKTYDYDVTVKNVGTVSADSYTINIVTEDALVLATETFTTPLAPNATATHTIAVTIPHVLSGTVLVRAVVVIEGDEQPLNDAVCPLTINVTPHPGYELDCDAAQITVGTGGNNYTLPTNNYYYRSYTQQIYDAAEINLPVGTPIEYIAFQVMAGNYTKTNQQIYLGNITKSTFANSTDHIPAANLAKYYDGSIQFSNAETWCKIYLDEPFIYTGDNIAVVFANNQTTMYPGTANTFRTGDVTGKAIAQYLDNTTTPPLLAPGTLSTTATNSTYNYRNYIQFGFCDKLYTLNPANQPNGATITMDPDPVPEGEDAVVTIDMENECLNIVSITIEGYVYVENPTLPYTYPFNDVQDVLPVIIVETEDIYYPITVSYGLNGVVLNNGVELGNPEVLQIQCGTDETFVLKPEKGYVVESLTVDGTPVIPPIKNYPFTDIKEEHTLEATFMPSPFEFCFIIEGNGTGKIEQIEAGITYPVEDDCVGVEENSFQQFLFTTDDHNVIAAIYINGVFNLLATATGSFVVQNVQASYEIKVVFNLVDLTIVATAGENGTIDPIGTVLVPYGYDQSFLITPNEGYVIDQIFVDNDAVAVENPYLFKKVEENRTIHVTFKQATMIIHMSWSDGGVLTPAGTGYTPTGPNSGDVEVLYNADLTHYQEITFVPETGYKVVEVFVNGELHQNDIPKGLHNFYYVTGEQWIHVNFEQITYSITSSFAGNGTISELGTVLVGHGEDKTYTFEPLAGHKIANVYVDAINNYDAVNNGFYTFENVTANYHTIHVVFVPMTYTISAYVQDGEGFVNPQGEIPVTYEGSKLFTFTPAYGWELEKVLIDGLENMNAVLTGNYTFLNVSDNHTVDVFYTIKRFTMKSMTTGGGAIEPSGTMEVDYNTDVTYTITAEEGYEIAFVLVNGEDVGAVDIYTFSAIDADGTIEVIFTEITNPDDPNDPNDPDDPNDPNDPTSITNYEGISVYSNTNVVYIINENLVQINDVSIYDIYGRMVWQGQAPNKLNTIAIDAASGIYAVRIATETAIITKKVSIIR